MVLAPQVRHSNHTVRASISLYVLFSGAGESTVATSLATLAVDLRVDRRGAMMIVIIERKATAIVKRDRKVSWAQEMGKIE